MCEFKSAIVLRDGKNKGGFKLLLSPWTNSHSDLIAMHYLHDDGRLKFARVEFKPKSAETVADVKSYNLTIDEERCPDWFDEEMKDAVSEKMRTYIASIIVIDSRKILIGGEFIVSGKAEIGDIKQSNVNSISGSAKVGSISGSATVDIIYGSATVGNISGSAKIISDNRNSK